jgi:putative nucleotidyltransferase with HDIG domain
VASGSYIVSGTKDEILEAYLGTCVGISLCDRAAGVGGLIHLLLPEPTGIAKPWQPESYATTGLPRFIQALCGAGAQKRRLEACTAGGALIGPVIGQAPELDIGGRTTEVVQRILREAGIPVTKTEMGGYFSCRLSLNLRTWESEIHPIGDEGTNAETAFKKPTPSEIDKAVHSVRPIPQVALKVVRMIRDGHSSMQDVANEVRQDQVISAGVIRLCNSVFTAPRTKVGSIDRALVILGEQLLLQVVVSAALEQFFSGSGKGYSLCKGGLFQHALGAAMTAEELAKLTGSVPSDIAYTAGLLHDIGKVVLDQYVASATPFFYRRTQVDGIELCGVEAGQFGVTHPEVGKRLAERWSLPKSLIDTIRYHHLPERATIQPELTHLVYLADLLMSRFQVGQELERLNTDALTLSLQAVGLSPSDFPVLVDHIPRKIFGKTFQQATNGSHNPHL